MVGLSSARPSVARAQKQWDGASYGTSGTDPRQSVVFAIHSHMAAPKGTMAGMVSICVLASWGAWLAKASSAYVSRGCV